ncbi:SMP-30/gluconolactonase/LRE family protein [Pseudooceanicola sp. LIPI14-2-Ac024]|uniref:SMP-30/gluconolactonase/LRE family protein n=1 Tax=Pseudooceanicola sp. LIPI14-2-Ac024 TaxID=3344875 RepID=UPI0035D0F5EF
MTATVHDHRPCTLGEGPLWHPERQQLFWFDIVNARLLSQDAGTAREWQFDRMVSAAGWVDHDRLLIASESDLFLFDLETGTETHVIPLEADRPDNRSNDGRADPWGGFWIGTMDKAGNAPSGSIYRYWQGELRRLHDGLTTPNAICFAPDRSCAYFADTRKRMIFCQSLDPATGWPAAAAETFLDLRARDGEPERKPDGAVTDAAGNLWIAQWGSARVACHAPDGRFLHAVPLPTPHSSCPAFGGPDLTTLYVTTARQGLSEDAPGHADFAGKTYVAEVPATGRAEPAVQLS